MYRANYHGMDEATMGEYLATLPQDKDGIWDEGRTLAVHNAHARALRMARLVAYLAREPQAADDAAEHDATLASAREQMAILEGAAADAEMAWSGLTEDEQMASIARERATGAAGKVIGERTEDDSDGRAARTLRAGRAAAREQGAPAGMDVNASRAADGRVARTLAPHSCEAPRAAGETWRAYGQRVKGCAGCAARRAHDTYGIVPQMAPDMSAAWEGMQGDRVAARGRSPRVGGNGIGAARITRA